MDGQHASIQYFSELLETKLMIKEHAAFVAGTILLISTHSVFGESPNDAQAQTQPTNVTTSTAVDIQSLFTSSGWMGDGEYGRKYIEFTGADSENLHSAPTSIKITYIFGPKSWGGFYWQNLPDNWGEKPGNNYSGSRFSNVTFWARGLTGSEVVEFKSGGIDSAGKTFRDSYVATIGRVSLSREWKQYQIPLSGVDMSSVIGAFCWVASADYNKGTSITFYLDDIALE